MIGLLLASRQADRPLQVINQVQKMENSAVAFRSSFWTSFLAMALVPIIMFAAGEFVILLVGRHPDAVEIHWMWPLLAIVVTSLALVSVAVFFFPVYVGTTGIRSYNFWGLYNTMTWTEMATISRFQFLWLHFIVLQNNKATIYVPLFLSDQRGFNEMVNQFAGPENALVRALNS